MVRNSMAALGMLGFFAFAGVAFAETASTAAPAQPTILEVNKHGGALMRGTVGTVSADSFTVASWGGAWTVNVDSAAKLLPSGSTLADMKSGDFVGVQGTVDASASWTVNATLVRDWSARKAEREQAKENKQSVRAAEHGASRAVQGTLSNLDAAAATFTLTNTAGTAFAVSLDSGAKVLGKRWTTIALSDAKDGDTVRVFGAVASTTIAASVFRDVSVK